jgi:membrane-bound metal-dependent hydrolase YbcI (DUF457 family)
MDTITQGLFGAAVAQVGFRGRIGREAGWVAAACAASPDADIFTARIVRFFGNGTMLDHLVYHRGASHSLFAIPIIDVFITGTFIVGLAACYIIRRLPLARRKSLASAVGAATLLAVIGYIGAGRLMHDRAIDTALAALDGDRERVIQADAYPAIGHIFLWRVVIETDDAWIAMRVHHFSQDPPTADDRNQVAKQPDSRWIRRAQDIPEYDVYNWFAGDRLRAFHEHDEANGRHVVLFHDMRYAADNSGVESMWPLAVEVSEDGEIEAVYRVRVNRRADFRKFVAMAWRDMWNP